MIEYRHLPGVKVRVLGKRKLLALPQGGSIAMDPMIISLWEFSHKRELGEIIASFRAEGTTPYSIQAALACLCEAGLLVRTGCKPVKVFDPPEDWTSVHLSSISVVLVNFNSLDWLKECLLSLDGQTLAPFEIIIIDNASNKDPGPWLAEYDPDVIFRRLDAPISLAAALNYGVELASGDYFLLLNPDTRLESNAMARMLAVAEGDKSCGAVVPLLKFTWAPAFLNGLGNYAGAFSWGTDNALGHLDLGQFEEISEVPSACFAAALIPKPIWDVVGTLDEGFPLYYEDIEWSYRVRSFGYRVLAAPQAVIYHAFGHRIHDGKDIDLSPSKLANVTYGRLRFATKILTGWRSVGFKLSYALDDLIRAFLRLFAGKMDKLRAYARGWMHYWQTRAHIYQEKAALKSRRVVGDRELLAYQKELPDPFIWRGLPELTWDSVVSHYLPLIQSGTTKPFPEFETVRPKFLIISNEIIDIKMAGPGMRYLEIARALRDKVDITLAVPGETTLDEPGLCFASYAETRPTELRGLVEDHDVALVTAFTLNKFSFLSQANTRLVVDLYDPFIFENFYYYLNEPLPLQADINRQAVDLLNRVAHLGDFYICGSERQRDLWIGLLVANHRVNPYTFAQDDTFRQLVDVVGIGFPDRELDKHPFLRGNRPEFPEDCRIVLWGGGVWDWLDPLTLLRAWPQVIERYPEARLVFLGTRHPNPDVPRHQIVPKLESYAKEIGQKDHTVFFIEWLSYADREALLSEADIGVTLHVQHIETHFSVRTRVLDYIWACLPILISEGDVTSQWVSEFALGRVVHPNDPDLVANALLNLLSQPKDVWEPAFDVICGQFKWTEVVDPLRRYVLGGGFAADHLAIGRNPHTGSISSTNIWRSRFARAQYILKNQGFQALVIKTVKNIRIYLTKLL